MTEEVFAMLRPTLRIALFPVLLLLAAPLAAGWVPLGPFGGSVGRIYVDPADARTVYALSGEGVLFKSADGGGNWKPLHSFGSFWSLAIDPARSSTIYAVAGAKILKSVDGGSSWSEAGPRSASAFVEAVAVDPSRATRVYAGGSGIWVSTNRGASWKPARVPPPDNYYRYIQALIATRKPAGTVFAATQENIYKSVDAGATWSVLPLPAGIHEVGPFAVAPSDSRWLYARFGAAGLFRSTDGGGTWQPTHFQLPVSYDYVISLAVSPHSPRTLWLITSYGGLFRSTDGGDTWTTGGLKLAGSADAVAVAPSAAGTVYVGLAAEGADVGGVFATTDGGSTWTRRNHGLFGLGVALALDPDNAGVLWAGHRGGLYRSDNAGQRWIQMPLPLPPQNWWGYRFYDIVPDPRSPSADIYALCDSLWRTADGGESWTDLFAPQVSHLQLVSLRMGPAAAPQLWGSDEYQLYASADDGVHWVSRANPELGCGILDFALAPSSASTLYMTGAEGRWWSASSPYPYPPDTRFCDDAPLSAFFRSDDGGATWTDLSADLRLHLPHSAGWKVAVDPVDPRLVYLATRGGYYEGYGDGVWKSTDGGATWSRAGNRFKDKSMTAIAASPVAGVVWASTEGQVFLSRDAGATWKNRSDGLLARGVYGLIFDPSDPSRVYAATSAGVWVWSGGAP